MGSEVRGCPEWCAAQGEERGAAQGETRLRYAIMDPTGNITALVEDAVEVACQPAVAAAIMERHPEVEQVGFVQPGSPGRMGSSGRPGSPESGPIVDAALRMAGGEFCGNATMSAAALFLLRTQGTEAPPDGSAGAGQSRVLMRVSGAALPVEVLLTRTADARYDAAVCMPRALAIEDVRLCLDERCAELPVVRMEGISHVVVRFDSPFFGLLAQPKDAERAVRLWCEVLGADGLGLMFVDDRAADVTLTPLVYVPGSGTVFWENSCASGSSAVGRYLAARTGAALSLRLREPGGTLGVSSDPASGVTWLSGSVALVGSYVL